MTFTFSGTTATYINDNWELVEHVLDFNAISDKQHEGAHAARALAKTLSDFDILYKISFLNC